MVCPQCGNETGSGDTHCSQCGFNLNQHVAAMNSAYRLPPEISGAWIIASSIAIGLAVDIAMLRHDRGFNILIVGALAIAVWAAPIFRRGQMVPLLSTSMFAAGTVSIFFQSSGPADFPLYLIWGAALILYCVTCRDRLLGLEGSAIDTWRGRIFEAGVAVSKDIQSKTSSSGNSASFKQVALGIAVAIPIITFLLILMESADMAFEMMLKDVFDNFEEIPGHVFWTMLFSAAALYFTGCLSLAKKDEPRRSKKAGDSFPLLSSMVVMILVAAVVAAFLFIHLKTMALSEREITKLTGMNYRAYIRTGFAELLVCETIIGLTALFILHTKDWTQHAKTGHRIVVWILLALTACLSASCASRLWYYVDEYGLTLVRYANCAGIAISIMSLVFMARLAARPMDFNRSAGVIFRLTVFVFTIWSCAMPARLISRINAEKILEGKTVETSYLEYLGPDAFPALAEVMDAGINRIHHTEREYVMGTLFEQKIIDKRKSLLKADFFERNPADKPAIAAADSILISISRDRPKHEKAKAAAKALKENNRLNNRSISR